MTPEHLKRRARALGFDAVGVASAEAPWPAKAHLQEFLGEGRHGDMDWMTRAVPGSSFYREGSAGRERLRFNFCKRESTLDAAAERLAGLPEALARSRR